MPTYQYTCTTCGDQLEVVQKFTDDPLTECHTCDGQLRKVFSPVGIVFKGSGFYRTDSRRAGTDGKGSKAAASTGSSETSTGAGSSGSSGTDSAKSSSVSAARANTAA